MNNPAESLTSPPRVAERWIIGRNQDLLWFLGGGLSGYFLFWLHAGLKLDMVMVWFVWVTLLDVPHFFGTYSRTYLDRVEWKRHRPLLLGSLAWILAGPIMLGLSAILYSRGVDSYRVPFFALVALVGVWAYLHVVRQHFGVMRLYARKNGDMMEVDRRLDGMMVHLAMIAPGIGFALRHPDIRDLLGLPPELRPIGVYLVVGSAVVAAGAVGVLIIRQIVRRSQGLPLNLPKLLYLGVVLPYYAFICYHPATLTAPLIGFIAFVTIAHDIHYHALVWFHHRNRFHDPANDPERFGWAARLSRSLPTFFGCALGFSVILTVSACFLGVIPGCVPVASAGNWILFGEFSARELLASLIFGIQFHHYFLDQFIWRPGRDSELRENLGLTAVG